MKNIRKVIAGIASLSLAFGTAACGNSGSGGGEVTSAATAATTTVTTSATVEKNTETLLEEEESVIEDASSRLKDEELENKTIKWLAHYDDFNPSSTGNSKSVSLEYFEKKYGGKVEWYPTTWENRYNDLSTYVLGGEGIDFFPSDTAALPRGVTNGMFQPVDDYIDINDDLWQNFASSMELFNFNGKHYNLITNVIAEEVVVYSQKTIDENGLEDPTELWEKGEWNWDSFKKILTDYVDLDNDQYGLDGFWAEKALFLSAGVPGVSVVDGHLHSNLMDPTVEKAMNFEYDLFKNDLVFDRSLFDWTEHPEYMAEGKQLFYIIGSWTLKKAPETWTTKLDPEDVRIVPVPCPADSDKQYMAIEVKGWCLCKGAANPQGVARFAECEILAQTDPDSIEVAHRKFKDDYKWPDDLIAANDKIDEMARENPVFDLSTGVSSDVASITTDGGDQIGLRAALHGYDWPTTRDMISAVVEDLVKEADDKLAASE